MQKMLPSKLLTPLNPIIKLNKKHSFPNTRFGFCKVTQKQQENEETINEITSVFNNNQDNNDFISRIKSFQNPLNPNLVQSIIVKNQSCDPQKLLPFFNWSVHEKGILPNLDSFLILAMSFVSNVIKGYCMSGKMEDAKRVFLEMEEDGCRPNLVTYNLLISGLCQYGLVDEVVGYKKAMVEKSVVPDAYSYSVIIDELCKRNRFSDAKLVLDGMNKAGLRPKSGTYSSLIFGFMREGKIEEALSSNDDMIDKNCEPGSALWSINNLMEDL